MEAVKKMKREYMNNIDNISLDVYDTSKHKRKIDQIYNNIDSKYISDTNNYKREENKENKKNSEIKIRYKTKFLIRSFLACLVLFICVLSKLAFYDKAMSNRYINAICTEYKKSNKKEDILLKIENVSSKIHKSFYYAIPDKFAEVIKDKYYEKIKPKVLNFNLKETVNAIVFKNKSEDKNNLKETVKAISQIDQENTGMGGGGPITVQTTEKEEKQEKNTEETDQNVKKILSKNISIISPTTGTITSRYGPREQIFAGVDPYHTGIDIANVLNTPIISATTGKIVTVDQNNKYYGKMVEIETDEVIFKYGHMNEIDVNQGDNINQGEKIGLMGKTGYATGSHLHFEIRINNTSVDPEKIIKLE